MKRIIMLLTVLLAAFGFFSCADEFNPTDRAKEGGSLAVQASFADSSSGLAAAAGAGDYYDAEKFSSGKIIVKQNGVPNGVTIIEPMNISGATATASVSGLAEGTWNLTVVFYDSEGDITFQGSTTVEIIPGEITIANVVLTGEGSISITIDLPIHPAGLVLWNKMEDLAGLADSEIGPQFNFSVGSFVSGKFGNAIKGLSNSEHELASIALDDFSLGQAGTIELWAKMENVPVNVPNQHIHLFGTINNDSPALYFGFNNNNGQGGGGLDAYIANQSGSSRPSTGRFGSRSYESILGAGKVEDWHHYALVWDINGLPNNEIAAVYLNGVLHTTKINTGDGASGNFVLPNISSLSVKPDSAFNPNYQQDITVDNIKIWDYAKTSFDLTQE